jgi:hypothetical protein
LHFCISYWCSGGGGLTVRVWRWAFLSFLLGKGNAVLDRKWTGSWKMIGLRVCVLVKLVYSCIIFGVRFFSMLKWMSYALIISISVLSDPKDR